MTPEQVNPGLQTIYIKNIMNKNKNNRQPMINVTNYKSKVTNAAFPIY